IDAQHFVVIALRHRGWCLSHANAELNRARRASVRTRRVKGGAAVAPRLTFLVLHLGELGVDHVAVVGLLRALGLGARLGAGLLLLLLRVGVHLLAELLR